MIEIKNLCKKYDRNEIFNDASCFIGSGLYLISGENGVGKTTLLNILLKYDDIYYGNILIDEINIKNIDKANLRTNYISYVSQKNNLFDYLRVSENIDLLAKDYDMSLYNKLVEGLTLKDVIVKNNKISRSSGGEKRKIALLIALLSNAPIIILDEPDNDLDKKSLLFLISHFKTLDKTILIVSHSLKEYCDINEISIEKKKIKYSLDKSKKIKFRILKKNKKISKKIMKKLNKKSMRFRTLTYVLFLIILSISIFTSLKFVDSIANLKREAARMNDNTLKIYPPVFNPLIFTYGTADYVDTTKAYFTQEDMNKINHIDNVVNVSPISAPLEFGGDGIEYELNENLNYSKLDYIKYEMEEYKLDDVSNITLQTPICTDSKKISEDGDSTCPNEMMYGELPKDESNEIAVDGYLAMYYSKKLNLDSLSELIGKKITIHVTDNELGDKKKDFVVSGILDPIHAYNDLGNTITAVVGYEKDGIYSQEAHPWENKSERAIEDALMNIESAYESIGKTKLSKEDIVPLKDNAYPGFYVEVKDKEDVENIVKKIENYDSNIYIRSNYTTKHSNNFIYLKSFYIHKIIMLIVLYITFLIMLILLFKMYLKELENISIKLEDLGFENNEIEKFEKSDKFILYQGILLIALIVFISFGMYCSYNIFGVITIVINIMLLLLGSIMLLRWKKL